MKIQDAGRLVEVFQIVAEKQAFVFPEPLKTESSSTSKEKILLAAISFQGRCSGRIKLAVPEDTCGMLADNVLGLEEGQARTMPAEAKDVIAEMLNVLCGQFLTAVEGTVPVFNLSAPEISSVGLKEWDALRSQPGCRAVSIDDSSLLLCLEL